MSDTQPFLFDHDTCVYSHPSANARRTDPPTSFEAAERITRDGTVSAQRLSVLRAVIRFAGRTSREIAVLAEIDRHLVARRLPELETAGLVTRGEPRVCSQSTKRLRALTWFATGKAIQSAKERTTT